jgi:hypothetical protein
MITQDEDAHLPSAQKENVPPINHDTPGRGMMRSIASGVRLFCKRVLLDLITLI